jgi:hypothetical protein
LVGHLCSQLLEFFEFGGSRGRGIGFGRGRARRGLSPDYPTDKKSQQKSRNDEPYEEGPHGRTLVACLDGLLMRFLHVLSLALRNVCSMNLFQARVCRAQ